MSGKLLIWLILSPNGSLWTGWVVRCGRSRWVEMTNILTNSRVWWLVECGRRGAEITDVLACSRVCLGFEICAEGQPAGRLQANRWIRFRGSRFCWMHGNMGFGSFWQRIRLCPRRVVRGISCFRRVGLVNLKSRRRLLKFRLLY